MGDIADAMLDGTLCECCGEYIGSDAGYPQYCSDECAADSGAEEEAPTNEEADTQRHCTTCGKRLKSTAGVRQHMRDKHGEKG